MQRLHLIGVQHNDPDGYERTTAALRAISPAIIAAEWPGMEYDKYRTSEEVASLQREIDQRCRAVLLEFGMDGEAYDQANEIASRHFGEIRAAKDYAHTLGLPIIPTESAPYRIQTNERFLQNPDQVVQQMRDWLADLCRKGKRYDPMQYVTFDGWEYERFARHLSGKLPLEDVTEWLQCGYLGPGVINAERTRYQVEALQRTLGLSPSETVAHIGGLAHLLDDENDAHPANLYQELKRRTPVQILRHSLREFEIA